MDFTIVEERKYSDLDSQEVVKWRKPFKILGFSPNSFDSIAKKIQEKVDALEFYDYSFDGENLPKFGRAGIHFRHLAKGDVRSRTASGRPWYLAQTVSAPRNFFSDLIAVPYNCDKKFYCKSRVWLAASGTRAPLHRDIPHNLIIVFTGHKKIRLVSPGNTSLVYSHSLVSRTPNFADLNLHAPDLVKFPRAEALHIYETDIRAGEMLYLPPLWWHDVKNLAATTSVNFWFAPFGLYGIAAKVAHFMNKGLSFWSRKLSE